MNIVVLMKQVPDTEAPVEIAESNVSIDTEEVKWVINPYDEFCLEEALLIKEAKGEGTVTLVTVGPDHVAEAIRVAYAMGVDEAIHINDEFDDEQFGAVDPHTTATIIATALKEIPYDLIIAGQRAVDDDSYLVPALVARKLDLPMISLVTKQETTDSEITCEQSIEGGTAVVKAALPALITTQKGINEPRYPNFRAIMKAKKRKVDERELEDIELDPETLGLNGARVKIRTMEFPPERGQGKIIEGTTPAEKAQLLVKLLKEEACVI
jgi:electron transfer flavoprotein beta subunit